MLYRSIYRKEGKRKIASNESVRAWQTHTKFIPIFYFVSNVVIFSCLYFVTREAYMRKSFSFVAPRRKRIVHARQRNGRCRTSTHQHHMCLPVFRARACHAIFSHIRGQMEFQVWLMKVRILRHSTIIFYAADVCIYSTAYLLLYFVVTKRMCAADIKFSFYWRAKKGLLTFRVQHTMRWCHLLVLRERPLRANILTRIFICQYQWVCDRYFRYSKIDKFIWK